MQIASTPSWRHMWYWLRENPYPLTSDTVGCPLILERLRLLCVYSAGGLFKMLKAILGRSSGKI